MNLPENKRYGIDKTMKESVKKMIKSMTGYGRNEAVVDGRKILTEIKSVNHRYSDYNIKLPRYYSFLEDKVKKLASESITRGKVDIFISIERCEESDEEVILNKAFVETYLKALEELRDTFKLEDDISVMTVARNSDVFRLERREEDEEALWAAVKSVMEKALEDFSAMREREGERIGADLSARVEYMKKIAEEIDEHSPRTVAEYSDRLRRKIEEVLADRTVDEARLLTEVAIFADKVAVNEEIVRLGSHFDEFHEILNSSGPAGRRLDFLTQEINRETNTIGSKANDVYIAKKVVELKSELEKMREQIQNIE